MLAPNSNANSHRLPAAPDGPFALPLHGKASHPAPRHTVSENAFGHQPVDTASSLFGVFEYITRVTRALDIF